MDFTAPVTVATKDNVLFYNCTFHDMEDVSQALFLRSCKNVLIKDCKFYNINTKKDGKIIKLEDCQETIVDNNELYNQISKGHSTALWIGRSDSKNITLSNNYIHDVSGNGIATGGCSSCQGENIFTHDIPVPGLKILNNRIYNIGLSPDEQGNSPKHGMYIKAQDFLIEGNVVVNSHDGVGISVRSTGIVRGNFVKNTKLGGIGGSFMKPEGASKKLIIENNVVIQRWNSNVNYGDLIRNVCCGSYPKRYNNSYIRFNTMVAYENINPNVSLTYPDEGRRSNDRVYGNILVDLRNAPSFFKRSDKIEYNSNNFMITNLNDFVDPENDDFRLKATSDLIDNIQSEQDFPTTDKDGNAMIFPLEPGAFQFKESFNVQNYSPPSSVVGGQSYTINIPYTGAGTADMQVLLQNRDESGVTEGSARVSINGSGIATLDVTVNSNAKPGINYQWQAYITPAGGNWSNRYDNKSVKNISYNNSSLGIVNILNSSNKTSDNGISFYPNPANDRLILQSNTFLEDMERITIYDLQGRITKQISKNDIKADTEISIDLSTINEGLYILSIKSNKNAVQNSQFLIKH
ncbi:T9SS type A sorting domain-containing protein [uncultured Aquimarina sp.]|uniref:T9SS type A sorting domain-containing protein n=1 Tax=uncultured Aquimarina sp. TaxID=575652 RepID=UPI002631C2E2|nr:T9SS type A sorting domain-containing protein [uncultured Aquimarina sp.]